METSIPISTFNIHFHIVRKKIRKDGKAPIYMRITVDGKRSEYSIKRYLEPSRWNVNAGKAKGTNEESREINNHIETLRNKVNRAHDKLIDRDEDVNSAAVKAIITGKNKQRRLFIEVFEFHNKMQMERIGVDYAEATVTRYSTTLMHVKKFLVRNYGKTDIMIHHLDQGFLADLERYFKVERKCNHNTTMKYIKNVKRVIHFALERGWLEKDPFKNFSTRLQEVEREYLNEDEVFKIEDKVFSIHRLDLVRDIFILSCYTSLAYIDITRLTKSHLIIGIEGDDWIMIKRKKTDILCRIPLMPKVKEILKKYENHPLVLESGRLIPVFSNQKMNAYLKEIATLCEIDKTLTFHMARHTFVSLALKSGMTYETIKEIIGHANIRITQQYGKMDGRKISGDMKRLQRDIAKSKNKHVG